MDIGNKIKYLRRSRHYKQWALAHKLNVSTNAISQYETGKRKVDLNTIKKLANIFEISIEYFISENFSLDSVSGKPEDSKSNFSQKPNYTSSLLKVLINEGSIKSPDDIKGNHLKALTETLKQDALILLKERGDKTLK